MRLPVSGVEVELRQPVGADEVFLMESTRLDAEVALELARRLACTAPGRASCWEQLPVADLDALFLFLRQEHFGDLVRAEAVCPSNGCRKRIDISFKISEYLGHHPPRRPRGLELTEEPEWFRLRGASATFRLPCISDLLAVSDSEHPEREIVDRCVRPRGQRGTVLRRIQRAMAAMAPNLCQELEAQCPECGASIRLHFDPQEYTLRELQGEAVSVHEDVHTLASVYHWPEADILALPRHRRVLYVEMALEERRSA